MFGERSQQTGGHKMVDAFYASVQQLLDPSLRGKPIAVGSGPMPVNRYVRYPSELLLNASMVATLRRRACNTARQTRFNRLA